MDKIGVKNEFLGNCSSVSFCQACLSTDRALSPVSKYVDILYKICELQSTIMQRDDTLLCWECMSSLHKVKLFVEKIADSQKILESFVNNKQGSFPLPLSRLTTSEVITDQITLIYEENEIKHIKLETELDDQFESIDNDDYCIVVKDELDYTPDSPKDIDKFEDAETSANTDKSYRKSTEFNLKRNAKRQAKYRFVNSKVKKHRSDMIRNIPIEENDVLPSLEEERKDLLFLQAEYKCVHCVEILDNEQEFVKHNKKYHDVSVGSFVCHICRARFLSNEPLAAHAAAHRVRRECRACGRRCCAVRAMRRHVAQHDRLVQCLACGLYYKNVRLFYDHYKAMHSRFECNECGKRCKSRDTIIKHLRYHFGYVCPFCKKKLKNSSSYNNHIECQHTASLADDAYCVPCDRRFKCNRGSPISLRSTFLEEVVFDQPEMTCIQSSAQPTSGSPTTGTGATGDVTKEANSVRDILETSAEGRQILELGLQTGALAAALRGRLCKFLLEKLVTADNPVLPTDAQLLTIANEIGRLFTRESPPLYYTPYLPADAYQPKRNTSGWLVNARRARRTYLISLNLLAKPKTRFGSTSSSKSGGPPLPWIDLGALEEGDTDKVLSALEQLSSPAAGPWQEVSALWRETTRARLHYVYFEKGTLQMYLNKYPILQSPDGWRLLVSDYEQLYPDKAGGLRALEASTGMILQSARNKQNSTKDTFLRKNIADTLAISNEVNPETSVIAAILLIGCLFNIPPARRSKKEWHASRAEILDSFVSIVNTEADVNVTIEARRKKYEGLKVPLQPFIIWCRESGVAFAVCDKVLYKFSSLPEALDVIFKIFHATGTQYPSECYNIWIIIQIAFYKVQTSYDRLSQSVKETLVTLGVTI